MNPPDPLSVYEAIKDGYLRYYNTAFWLRDPALRAERRQLLEQDGVVFTDPLLEPVMPYEPGQTIAEACEGVGLPRELADQLGGMLFNADHSFSLRTHQADSLTAALAPAAERHNIVVTAGTGSGKTECFLLPIFARILTEAAQWDTASRLHRWWDHQESSAPWQPARVHEDRAAAARAMILYPTNALVEDQIARLRRATSAAAAAGSPPIYFGRYTGATPGLQNIPTRNSDARVREVADQLRQMEKRTRSDRFRRPRPALPVPRSPRGRIAHTVGHDRRPTGSVCDELLDAQRHPDARAGSADLSSYS